MKKFKTITCIFLAVLMFGLLIGCSGSPNDNGGGTLPKYDYEEENEFADLEENPFVETLKQPNSTFSLDVNTASYSILRKLINDGSKIPKEAVRIEEMVNYFSYDYEKPTGGEALKINDTVFDSPWSDNKILTVGLKAEEIDLGSVRNNLVFLIDVSGSMAGRDRLELIQGAFSLLTEKLTENDTISIITYASNTNVLLEGINGSQKSTILNAIASLQAGGATAGKNAISKAYSLAVDNFISGGNNRIILATDGDFNVGYSNLDDLESFIEGKRETGVYLSVLGFGYGNLKDERMEALAKKGNGNYAYIDSLNEAKKVLIEQMGGTMNTVARDVKAQIEFNPFLVKQYRLIGYENKQLTEEDWDESKTDAGEIGSGFTVTAVYEIVENNYGGIDTMKGNYALAKVRYKEPDVNNNIVMEINEYIAPTDYINPPNDDSIFISCVVQTGLLLRNSIYKGSANYTNIIEDLRKVTNLPQDSYKSEFLELVKKLETKMSQMI